MKHCPMYLAALVIAAGVFLWPTPVPNAPHEAALDLAPVVKVYVYRGGKVAGYGAGTAISGRLILTAKHVAAAGDALVVEDRNGKLRRATVVWQSMDQDLAVVFVAEPMTKTSELGCRQPARSERVRAAGQPFANIGIAFAVYRGWVASNRLMKMGTEVFLVLDVGVVGGMSGGPLYDAAGKVVGVIVRAGAHVGLAVPGDVVCRQLEEAGLA